MWRRYSGVLTLGVAILFVAAACSTPAYEVDALQPTGGTAQEAGMMDENGGQMLHAGMDDVIDVELSDFSIDMGPHVFTPGESIEFRVVNTGVAPHEFRLSNQVRIDEHVGAGHALHADEGGDGDMEGMEGDPAEGVDHAEAPGAEAGDHPETPEAQDVILLLEPGESGTLLFHFPHEVGDYVIAVCLVPGHYEAGMATGISFGV